MKPNLVAFQLLLCKITGLVDCVEDKKTGYLAKPFDYKDFAEGIIWLLNKNIDGKISKNSRDRALNKWSYEKISYEYQNLYFKVIEDFKLKIIESMLIKDTPILILAFNRDKKFNSCLENIYKFGFRKIYVSLDGPRNGDDQDKQKVITKICKNYSEWNLAI